MTAYAISDSFLHHYHGLNTGRALADNGATYSEAEMGLRRLMIFPLLAWAGAGAWAAETRPLDTEISRWENASKALTDAGTRWIQLGQSWEKFQPKLDEITRLCEPDRLAEAQMKKKRGKKAAERFLAGMGAAASLPSISEEEKANPCALAVKLPEFEKAGADLKQAWIGARRAGFLEELGGGYNDLTQGYSAYDSFGSVSQFFAVNMKCDGRADPGPTLRAAIRRLGGFYATTRRMVSGLKRLELSANALAGELRKVAASCPEASTDSAAPPATN